MCIMFVHMPILRAIVHSMKTNTKTEKEIDVANERDRLVNVTSQCTGEKRIALRSMHYYGYVSHMSHSSARLPHATSSL